MVLEDARAVLGEQDLGRFDAVRRPALDPLRGGRRDTGESRHRLCQQGSGPCGDHVRGGRDGVDRAAAEVDDHRAPPRSRGRHRPDPAASASVTGCDRYVEEVSELGGRVGAGAAARSAAKVTGRADGCAAGLHRGPDRGQVHRPQVVDRVRLAGPAAPRRGAYPTGPDPP